MMRPLVWSGWMSRSRTRPNSMILRPISGSTTSRRAWRMASALAGSCDSACQTRLLDAVLSDMDLSWGNNEYAAVSAVQDTGGLFHVGIQHVLNDGLIDGAYFGMPLPNTQVGAAIFGQRDRLAGAVPPGQETFGAKQLHQQGHLFFDALALEPGSIFGHHPLGHVGKHLFQGARRQGGLELVEQALTQTHIAGWEAL